MLKILEHTVYIVSNGGFVVSFPMASIHFYVHSLYILKLPYGEYLAIRRHCFNSID